MNDEQELYIRPRPMDTIAPEPIRWVWKGRLAEGMITDMTGDPGLGKSTILMDLVARVTTGRRMPDDPTLREPADAVILAGEDDPGQTIRPRLDNAGADSSRILYLDISTDWDGPSFPLSFPRDLDELDRVLSSRTPRLLVMDPLSMFFGESVDSNNDSSVRVVLSKLKAIAEKHRMAVLMARHRVKSLDTDPLRTGQGSMGILGAARFGLLVARDPTDEERERVIMAPTKQNASKEASGLVYRVDSVEGSDAAKVKWIKTTHIEPKKLLEAQKDAAEINKINDAITWIRDALEFGEQPIKDVMDKARKDGFDTSEVRKAIDLEGIRRKKGGVDDFAHTGAGVRWYYHYPGEQGGGTPKEVDSDGVIISIDPDEYNPNPRRAFSDQDFSVE